MTHVTNHTHNHSFNHTYVYTHASRHINPHIIKIIIFLFFFPLSTPLPPPSPPSTSTSCSPHPEHTTSNVAPDSLFPSNVYCKFGWWCLYYCLSPGCLTVPHPYRSFLVFLCLSSSHETSFYTAPLLLSRHRNVISLVYASLCSRITSSNLQFSIPQHFSSFLCVIFSSRTAHISAGLLFFL